MRTRLFFSFLLISYFGICVDAQVTSPVTKIVWPANYEPAKSKFFVHNEIEIAASPEKVWSILIDALSWSSWYDGCSDVRLEDTSHMKLQSNSVLLWTTMDMSFKSSVKEYVPNKYLAWESVKKQIQGYHVWLIIPTATGCKVITEESQLGWLTFFEKIYQPKKLKRQHEKWLMGIKNRAETN